MIFFAVGLADFGFVLSFVLVTGFLARAATRSEEKAPKAAKQTA
jgi:hypothetical protein